MDAIKRLQMEMSKHRESIDRLNKDIINEKSVLKQILKRIEDDKSDENELQNYGLVYECSNKICLFIRQRKELQRLIMMKMEIYTNHSEALRKKEASF